MKRLVLALALLAGPALADSHDHDHDHDHEGEAAHAFEAQGLKVVHPWVNATDGTTALVFMEVENHSDAAITLTGAEAHFATGAEIVGFALKDGAESWMPIASIPVTPGHHLEFAPKALAIRLTGLTEALEEGHHEDLHLETSAGEIEIEVLVEAANATQHSHAGHNH